MSPTSPATSPATPPAPRRSPRRRGLLAAAALLAAFGVGGGIVHLADGTRRATVLAMAPGPIASVRDGAAAAVKGEVTDVFGSRFVVTDATGKALVDTGPSGEGRDLVKPGETVTVQGRFDRGSLHAVILSHADGRQDGLDPGPGAGPPPPGPHWFRAAF